MKISIITPSYNQPEWLRLCVASVKDQPKADRMEPGAWCVEHIIQDGASGDSTLAILTAWSKEPGAGSESDSKPRAPSTMPYSFRYSSEADAGMYDAINKGLDKAGGDICAWLNCDEQYLPGTLAFVADFFEKNPDTDVLLGDAILLDNRMKPVSYRRIMVPSLWHTRLDHLHSLSCSMFFRKSVLPEPPLNPDKRIISDALLMDFFLRKKVKIKACEIPLSVYVVTGQNLSWTSANRKEMLQWSKEFRWPPSFFRLPVILWHRFRRLCAGAYKERSMPVEVFTPDSLEDRRCFLFAGGGLWPDQLKHPSA